MASDFLTIIVAFIVGMLIGVFVFKKKRKPQKNLTEKEEVAKNKTYEIAILNELSDKIGYSLGVQNVIEIIIGSLHDFMEYSAVSYMLLLPEKIVFRSYMEKAVSHKFITDVKTKMLNDSSVDVGFKNLKIEETLWGVNLNDESAKQVKSFFNIPLEISGKVVALLNVSDPRNGAFKEKDIKAVDEIAKQATQAVTKLQEVVESENSKLSAMVSSMTDGVVMTDMDFKILVINPAAKKALGFENKIDLSLADFSAGLNGKFNLKDTIDESIRLEKILISDEIELAGGFFQIAVSPVKDKWRALGCVVLFRDITHEKEVEKIKEDFTSMIVHELQKSPRFNKKNDRVDENIRNEKREESGMFSDDIWQLFRHARTYKQPFRYS